MPEGPAPDPAVQKLRLRYAKRGRLRFSSHRDFQRAFERALRRADVPMAYSAGFSPHPKISYANAAATGAASEAEYVEIALTRRCDPDLVRRRLDEALPPGLDVVDVVEATPGALADRLEASDWLVELPGVDEAELRRAVEVFLASTTVEVERLTKAGIRRFDARQAVLAITATRSDDPDLALVTDRVTSATSGFCAILRMVVRHTTPAVRPDDVLSALRAVADLAPPSPPRVTRLAQGPLDPGSGAVADPLATDRGAVDA
jgi:radical SAM-linked protein